MFLFNNFQIQYIPYLYPIDIYIYIYNWLVLQGVLPDGQEIAVKKLVDMSSQGTAEFETEVAVIASLQHINLVRLLGWSVHQQDKVLIFEFLENGSLDSHLFGN